MRTAGWRNRYSQAEYYPVDLVVVRQEKEEEEVANNNNNNSSISSRRRRVQFNVLQVQRGEVEGTYGTGATVWPAAMVMLK